MAEWREQQAAAKREREEAKQQAREQRSEALEVKAADQQLQNEVKTASRAPKRPTGNTVIATSSNSAPVVAIDEEVVVTARSWRGRQIKPPQHFDI